MVINELGTCPECKESLKGDRIIDDIIYKKHHKEEPYVNWSQLTIVNYIKENFTPPYYYTRLVDGHCPKCLNKLI